MSFSEPRPADLPRAMHQPVLVMQPQRRWRLRLALLLLLASIAFNYYVYTRYQEYLGTETGVQEQFQAGELAAPDKIALIPVSGTISPPFTAQILRTIKQAEKDSHVKGVVLLIDSPGGLVADSHQIYHALRKLDQESHKPINVAMKRIAASGGYYVAMGAGPEGRIFAEPTTWTGSIGVILPHYDVSGLAEKLGVTADALKTGEFKDTLNPFRRMSDREKKLWTDILDDSLKRFLTVIDENRKTLDYAKVKELATGQVYTSAQARENGLIDKIGFVEDAVADMKTRLGLERVRVVRYDATQNILELLTASAENARSESRFRAMLEAAVPQAYYMFTSMPAIVAP